MNNSFAFNQSQEPVHNFIDVLRFWAARQPDHPVYNFLVDGESQEQTISYAELDRQARSIASNLQQANLAGKRAIILCPPGLDYIASFLGCLYAGVTAVPSSPPDPARLEKTLPRLLNIILDSHAEVALTTRPVIAAAQFLAQQMPALAQVQLLSSEELKSGSEIGWKPPQISGDSTVFLQYTSGSTATPRGVMLTHDNLMHNLGVIQQKFSMTHVDTGVIWLPPYHNMGLIGGLLEVIFGGVSAVLMSPLAFLQKPSRWLRAISQYRATISGGPNFAYELCMQKISAEERAGLDLSSWDVAFNGAEPVRTETFKRFCQMFAPCGFRPGTFFPCYGLAEGTLMVTGGTRSVPPVIHQIRKAGLINHLAIPAAPGETDSQSLLGCGFSAADQEMLIVDPDTRTLCSPEKVGEVWLKGPSVAAGYWNKPEETEQTFNGYTADGKGPYLRTGDLGFLQNNSLCVIGRLKELIIIRGHNFYPMDIEAAAESGAPALLTGCGAAFSVDRGGEERLVVVYEVNPGSISNPAEVIHTVRKAISETHDLQTYAVVLVEPDSIPRTASGKIQHRACREDFLNNRLKVISSSVMDEPVPETAASARGASMEKDNLLREALLAMDPAMRQALISSQITARIAQILKIPAASINSQEPLTVYGLDSIQAVDLSQEFNQTLGINIPISALLAGTSIAQLTRIALNALTGQAEPETIPEEKGSPLKTSMEIPLTPGQRALWFIQTLDPENVAHNLVYALRVHSPLDLAAFRQACQGAVDRHPMLRTTFSTQDGEPVQVIHSRQDIHLEFIDASLWSQEQLNDALTEEVHTHFNLERGPLVQFAVYKRSENDHIFVVAMHHTIGDLWSLALLSNELGEFYHAALSHQEPRLAVLTDTYADHVRSQAEMLQGPKGQADWEYWQKKLAGELPVLDLPTDHPRPPVQSGLGGAQSIRLGSKLVDALKRLNSTCNCTMFTTLLAAYQAFLYRYTGQTDILVGSPKASRNRSTARVVGYFINPVVLRTSLSGDPAFSELLSQVSQTVKEGFEHDAYPFPMLVEKLHPARELDRSPLIQTLFSLQKTTRLADTRLINAIAMSTGCEPVALGDLVISNVPLEARVSPFDLTLLVAEEENELLVTFEYNTDLFEASTVQRMLSHLETMLNAVAENPRAHIGDLPLLSEAEKKTQLVDWNATQHGQPTSLCLHQLFEEQVQKTPDALALACQGKSMTYRQLNIHANQLARRLKKMGVGSESLVALCDVRSMELIIGLLGILKAGGAYLPLDPGYPAERLRFMLEDSHSKVMITRREFVAPLASENMHILLIDEDWKAITREAQNNLETQTTPENLAYVIYTSGSTGKPKGVEIPHRCIANHIRDVSDYYGITPQDRILEFASPNFDASLEQIFTALTRGACLVLRDHELWSPGEFSQKISELGLTSVNIPPAYWIQWLQEDDRAEEVVQNPQLRMIIIGGDVLPAETLFTWLQSPLSDAKLINAYGPTETTITATTYEVPHCLDRDHLPHRVPIGRPQFNRKAYILDSQLNPVPVGVPAELFIGGAGVARGYLNHPELTAEKFLRDPFSPDAGARMYRTGDLARFLPGGRIEFLGRADQQVKLRGFRIELGEIEAILESHPSVSASAVLLQENLHDASVGTRLVAFVNPARDKLVNVEELKQYLNNQLPGYMVPSVFITLEAMPMTPSSKVDRRALAALIPTETSTQYVAPRDPLEQELAGIWSEVLHVKKVGVFDNFFDLGGHSLMAAQLASRLRSTYHIELPLRDLFEAPTVAELAGLITRALTEDLDEEELRELLDEVEKNPSSDEKHLVQE